MTAGRDRLLTPVEVDRHAKRALRLLEAALDDHNHLAAYWWAYNGLDGVRSPAAASHASPGHSDPVPSTAALKAVQRVTRAGWKIEAAAKQLRDAFDMLREKDKGPEPPGPILRGWTPQAETERLREKVRAREAAGEGYGRS